MNSKDWLELVLVPLTALAVTWVWNDRQSRADRYRFINEDYESLLALYLENPRFGDPARCSRYWEVFDGDELIRYHYFAMKVHATMETIVDFYKRPALLRVFGRRGFAEIALAEVSISEEWIGFYRYHSSLHLEWLRRNSRIQESIHCRLAESLRMDDLLALRG